MSDDVVPNVLTPVRQPLFGYVGCSLLFHVGTMVSAWSLTALYAVITLTMGVCRTDSVPLEHMEVSIVSLPKSKTNVPDRASQVDRAVGEKPDPEPPPVQTSDLTFKTKVPDPEPGNVDKALKQQQLDEEQRKLLLDQLMNAPDGTVDRSATDPDGVDELGLAVLGAGSKADPEYVRWVAKVQALLNQNFRPLSAITQANPGIRCMMQLTVDPATGEITASEVSEPSGVVAYDQSAERAIAEVGAIPLPPEKYLPLLKAGVNIRFTPP